MTRTIDSIHDSKMYRAMSDDQKHNLNSKALAKYREETG